MNGEVSLVVYRYGAVELRLCPDPEGLSIWGIMEGWGDGAPLSRDCDILCMGAWRGRV